MKTHCLFLILGLLLPAFAQDQASPPVSPSTAPAVAPVPSPAPAATPAPPPAAPARRSAADLEKLVSPIALYPDPLVATILPASVYPLEIVQAARFVADTNNIAKIGEQPWDDNVKAIAQVPAALKKLNDDLPWTIQLGEAFLAQDKDVMDAIQRLRLKAQKIGMLQSSEQMIVTVTNTVTETNVAQQVVVVTNTIVQIESANPQVIYVPQYNPVYVYSPPPTYVYTPYDPFLTFAVGVTAGLIIANNCDWYHGGCYHGGYHGDVDINIDRDTTINRGDRPANRPSQKWQPDQNRLNRSGAAGTTSARSQEARGWGGGSGARPSTGAAARPSTGAVGARPSTGAAGARPSTGAVGSRPATGTPPASRPVASSSASRPSQSPGVSQARPAPAASRPVAANSAFSGTSSGAGAREYSNRGSSSRSSGGRSSSGGSRGGGGGRGGGRR